MEYVNQLFTKEIVNYINNHRSIYGLKTFAYFLLPSGLKTKARVKEKGYIKQDFMRNT